MTGPSMIAYGLSLNCSLDGLVIFPFMMTAMVQKVIKQMYKDRGIYQRDRPMAALYMDNNLDLALFRQFLTDL